jgi:hypothetical protein
MFLGRSFAALLVTLMPIFAMAQAPSSYVLTPAAAEKFVRATQQMVTSGAPANARGGGNPLDLSSVQAGIERNPAAR